MGKYYHFEKIDSTSTYLKKNYQKYDNLSFVSAFFQSDGHGRKNRSWISEDGENLLFSILIKDKKIIEDFAYISMFSAVEIMHILQDFNVENVSIKWPNDVFVNDKKICGILLESISYSSSIEALVLGIGLNINSCNFPNDLLNQPTSIFLETNQKLDIETIKLKLFDKMKKMLENLEEIKKDYLREIRNSNYLKNKKVYALINNEETLIKVLDINDDCSLKVLYNGEIISINSGEISFHI